MVALLWSFKTPTRSASETSSAKDWTCIFSITRCRCALTVRSVQSSAQANGLVGVAANDEVEHLPLARGQRREAGANAFQRAPLIEQCLVMSERLLDRVKQIVGRYRLGQEVQRACLEGFHGGRNVGIASDKYDRHR